MIQHEGVGDKKILNGLSAGVPPVAREAGACGAQRQRCSQGVQPALHNDGQVGTPESNECAEGVPPIKINAS